jgi:hypothetical protein
MMNQSFVDWPEVWPRNALSAIASEFARLDIGLKLAIPGLGIERSVPGTERRKFCGRKLLNLLFDCFDFAHVPPCPQVYQPGQPVSASSNDIRHAPENSECPRFFPFLTMNSRHCAHA